MSDLTKLPHHLDRKSAVCRAIIETPKGGRSKYDYEPASKLFRLKTVLPEGMSFPLDFGFIPSTLADDGDPLDVMVMTDEPSAVGALLDIRLIGVLEAREVEDGRTERNDRLLAVAAVTHLYADVKTAADLPAPFIDHLTQFWINKDQLEGKAFTALGVKGPEVAAELIHKASKAAKNGR